MTNEKLVTGLRQQEIVWRKNDPAYADLIRQMADAFEHCSAPLTCEMPLRGLADVYNNLISK